MKAAICTGYGTAGNLVIGEVSTPIPRKNEVLVKVRATTVTTADWRVRSLQMPRGFNLLARLIFGTFSPRQPILGTELAGIIESVGTDVKRFKPGDVVIAVSGMGFGCHAEYKCLPETGIIAFKPAALPFQEAAALSFGGLTALDYLQNKGKVQRGEKVLVYGASGSVGLAAVQIAKHLGAVVTGVCSTANLGLVQDMGAAHVIDYTKEDFMDRSEAYDVILDTVGTLSFAKCQRLLTSNGRLLLISAGLPELLQATIINARNSQKVLAGPAGESPALLEDLLKLVAAGKFKVVIDRTYPFAQIGAAYIYVGRRHKKGNIVIEL